MLSARIDVRQRRSLGLKAEFGCRHRKKLHLCLDSAKGKGRSGGNFPSQASHTTTFSQNEFLYALIFLTKSSVRTVPVGVIAELIRGDVFYWGQLMAGALLGSIPVALIYSLFVEHYVSGLTAGSVKA
jgi:hypothetical protein